MSGDPQIPDAIAAAAKNGRSVPRTDLSRCSKYSIQARTETKTYSINSSARARSESEMVSPSASAVLRLITKRKRIGCSIGKSAGLAPLKILST